MAGCGGGSPSGDDLCRGYGAYVHGWHVGHICAPHVPTRASRRLRALTLPEGFAQADLCSWQRCGRDADLSHSLDTCASAQALVGHRAAARTPLAGLGSWHGYSLLPSVHSVESKDGEEPCATCIADALSKVMIHGHGGCLQIRANTSFTALSAQH
jgi:hypothetical protein